MHPSTGRDSHSIGLVVGCVVGIVLVLLAVSFLLWRRRSGPGPGASDAAGASGAAPVETAQLHVNTMLIGGSRKSREALTRALLEKCGAAPTAGAAGAETDARTRYVEFGINHRRFAQIEPAEGLDPHSFLLQAGPVDGAILITNSAFDLSPLAREQAILLAVSGVRQFVVLVEGHTGEPLPDLDARVRAAALALLAQSGHVEQDVQVLLGQAPLDLPQTADLVLGCLSTRLAARSRDLRAPFMLTVDDVFRIKGRGTIATGMVERGVLRVGDQVEIGFHGRRKLVACQGIEIFRGTLDVARAGDNIGVLLGSLNPEEVARGAVLSAPATLQNGQEIRGTIRMVRPRDGDGAAKPKSPWKGSVVVGKQAVDGTARFSFQGLVSNEAAVVVTTTEPVVVAAGAPLVLVENGRTLGVGLVTQ